MNKENAKLKGSVFLECIPQVGHCPQYCNQCYYNRNPNTEPQIPEPDDSKIVRMNTGFDSNIQRDLVIETAKRYKHVFFNTSIPRFDFPGPVVFTANPQEEQPVTYINLSNNIMFVRLRVSSTNLNHVQDAVQWITAQRVPVVLTFMSYYTVNADFHLYEWTVRHVNTCWCPRKFFIKSVLYEYRNNRLVTYCGDYCKDCRNCEIYYLQRLNHARVSQLGE